MMGQKVNSELTVSIFHINITNNNQYVCQDDAVIPFELGYKLYQVALESRKQIQTKNQIKFVPFESDRALGHTFIYSAPEIKDLIG